MNYNLVKSSMIYSNMGTLFLHPFCHLKSPRESERKTVNFPLRVIRAITYSFPMSGIKIHLCFYYKNIINVYTLQMNKFYEYFQAYIYVMHLCNFIFRSLTKILQILNLPKKYILFISSVIIRS